MTPIGWFLSNDTSAGSETIYAVITGSKMPESFVPDLPCDPEDFGCCCRLLAHFPQWRERLPEVAERHPAWRPIVAAWDELTALYEQERMNRSGRTSTLYRRMQELIDEDCLALGQARADHERWGAPNEIAVATDRDGISRHFGR